MSRVNILSNGCNQTAPLSESGQVCLTVSHEKNEWYENALDGWEN
jgi:hypothetical protein